ncbi:Fe-S cluster assembly protein SufB [Ligilactobacillus equi]|uniref:ABC transporter-associated protein n=1 Tax=Ligilactobacillus equi DPC 6820 TaxID=1392007 RepID=V7HX45_9LACO|nr:Fe-S cluster assembly protein SufB [Ligilactobacillus equi]ETA74452.1 ABC transporter-associated protein [Ligilactobacillus equi DPC 6820]
MDEKKLEEKVQIDDEIKAIGNDYKYGFKDDFTPLMTTGKGLSKDVIKKISQAKNEPDWMLAFRLKAYDIYKRLEMPKHGPDLSELDLNKIVYFQRPTDHVARSWDDVPDEIKETFDKLGVPEAERQYLAGSSAQYESEVVYRSMKKEFDKLGIVFTDMDSAVQEYPDLVRQYFGKLVPPDDNKLAALNSAVWSGGTFIYVPAGVKLDVPVQSYFRINAGNSGQFERTLIIVDKDAKINYVEGCTAPNYSEDSLHAAVVEVNVLEDGYCRYTTIQNWSNNVYSLETKRAITSKNATMEWVDGNLGSKVTMKYPSVYLNGEGSHGTMLSIAFAGKNIHSDTGARMIHNAKNTSSSIVSKSLCKDGGRVDYRGQVVFNEESKGSKSHVECDTIIMDDLSASDTIPYNEVKNAQVSMEHEAKVSKISEDQLYYLMSRGVSEQKATEMIVMGFLEPFTKELPMEYAVELNRLIKYQMVGSVG